MNVLGVDPSLVSTGWAVIDYENGGLVDCGTIRTKPGGERGARLLHIATELVEIVTIHNDRGLDAAMESGFHWSSRSGTATGVLGMVRGVITLELRRHLGVEADAVTPAEIKHAATGRGNATKNEVTVAAVGRWGERCDHPDVADAAWCAEVSRRRLHRFFDQPGSTNGCV